MRNRLTERTAELRQERNFFEELINSLPELVFVIDRRGRLTRWNRGVEKLLARGPGGGRLRDPLRVIARANRRAAVATVDAVFRSGHASTHCRVHTVEGRLEPMLIVFLGSIVGFIVTGMFLPMFSISGQLSG